VVPRQAYPCPAFIAGSLLRRKILSQPGARRVAALDIEALQCAGFRGAPQSNSVAGDPLNTLGQRHPRCGGYRQRALPPVVAPHNAYYFWRQDAVGRDVVVSTAIGSETLARHFATTRVLDVFRCQYCVSLRSDMPISVSYGPSRPLGELLAEWRHFGLDPAPALHKMSADDAGEGSAIRQSRHPAVMPGG
jgi:hypothetical protein